jgi:hypothetical protein
LTDRARSSDATPIDGRGLLDRVGIPLAIACAALAYLLPLRAYGVTVSDDGWYLEPVLRMREGAVLYRDVWTFYAPLPYHLFEALFAATGPSILAARTLFACAIAATAALTYRLARRGAPPSIAWLPGAVFALVPGPWPKAFLGLCTAAFFVALARALEKPLARRFAVLGLVAGLTLATRQDLGVAQLGILLVAAPLPALFPRGFDRSAPRSRLYDAFAPVAAGLAAWALVLAPIVAYYASRGALDDLVQAVFVTAATQPGAFPPAVPILLGFDAGEGFGVALMMLLPPILYACFAIAVAARVRRDGVGTRSVLEGALLAYAVVTLAQAYYPVLLVRLLQSAVPFYVLTTWAIAAQWARVSPSLRIATSTAASVAAATWVGFVLFGLRAVHPSDLYTGSARMLHYDAPLRVLGDELQVGWGQAEEARLVAGYYATHTQPGEPTLVVPTHPLYWAIVDRPNPTRYLADHAHGHFVMTAAQKHEEAERLRASGARIALAEQAWYAATEPADPLRTLLQDEFRPVRSYVSMVILERDDSADARTLGAILRRTFLGRPTRADLDALRARVERAPDEPLPWKLLGALASSAGETDEALAAYRRAAALDPSDASALERAAALAIDANRRAEAAADLERARRIRESPTLRRLQERITE